MKGKVFLFSEDGRTENRFEPPNTMIDQKEYIIENLMLRYDLGICPIAQATPPKHHEQMRAVASEYECLKKAAMLHFEEKYIPIIVSAFIRPLYTEESDFAQNIRSLCISYYSGFVDIYIMSPEGNIFVDQVLLDNYWLRENVNELRDGNFYLRNDIYELV